MSRKTKSKPLRHGAVVEAPSEFGFVAGDSPPPLPVGPRAAARESAAPRGRSPWSPIWAGLRLALGLGVIFAIAVSIAWGAHRYALTSPRFAIREFAVTGNRHHGPDQLSHLAGIERGQNLFAVDTAAAEDRILESPWVQKVRVGRELPGTIRIEVVEREAAALAAIEGTLYLVSSEGQPFKAAEDKDPTDLPVLTGVAGRELLVDRARAVERFALGLEILRDYGALSVSHVYEPEEVNLGADGSVVLIIGKRGIALHLGTGPFRQKLLMAGRILGKLGSGAEAPGILFLDNAAHPERVVVRMR